MKIFAKLKEILEKDYTTLEKGLILLVVALLGFLTGLYLSPIKKGISMFSNNGNYSGCTYGADAKEEDFTEYLDDEDDEELHF